MELIKVCLTGLLMVSLIAGQEEGTEGLLSGLIKVIKTEVSNQMKIERKTLKEEILKEIRDDREKHEEIRKELERTREGKSIKNMFGNKKVCRRILLFSQIFIVSSNLLKFRKPFAYGWTIHCTSRESGRVTMLSFFVVKTFWLSA